MRTLFKPLLFICYVGIAASVAIHLRVLMLGRTIPTVLVFTLHLGIFLVTLPTLGMQRFVKRPYPKAFGRTFWSAVPRWLRNLSWGAFAYFVVVFLWYNFTHAGPAPRTSGFSPDLLVMFSAGWLSFYAVLAAALRFQIDAGEEVIGTSLEQ